jgi:D-glycero-D-manno-heptose 1,7-bisphosphate phosphatase
MVMNSYGICFDRDGTLIKHIPYSNNINYIELLPTVKEALQLCIKNNIKIFLHTNQSGIERNLYTLDDVINCNKKMIELLDVSFDEICIAPEIIYNNLNYRKPSYRFANFVRQKYKITKNNFAYIGDSAVDIQTSLNSGVIGYGVCTGINNFNFLNTVTFSSLLDAVNYFIDHVFNRRN